MANTTDTRIKPIFLTDQETGEKYELDFNREAVRFAESRKFDPSDVPSYVQTKIPEFFFYAFRMHHKNLSRNQTDKILETLGGLSESMVERLALLYDQARMSNTLQTDEELEKNSRMTVEMD